ncbi:hypothetical protein LIER_10295 [Lithospermum erythrorhizon]|uniref:Uncharacterized protein n=1 Tax=Lithospermum erythrorhizon TaxID=34254 RepID=A0AAV3PN14_LITER
MVKTRGGSSSSTRKEGSQNSRTSNPVEVLLLPWKDNIALEEPNSKHGEKSQPEHGGTNEGMGMHVPPIGDNSSKNPIPGLNSAERVASIETLISPTVGNQEGKNVDSQRIEVENVVGDVNPERGFENVEGVQPMSRTLRLRQAASLQRLIALPTLRWLKF